MCRGWHKEDNAVGKGRGGGGGRSGSLGVREQLAQRGQQAGQVHPGLIGKSGAARLGALQAASAGGGWQGGGGEEQALRIP